MNMLKIAGSQQTMTSIELVAIINEMRDKGKPELRHDHFMAKIEKHPGIDAPKFRDVYLGGNGQKRPCYKLPKRECALMVMSESLAVQAKVYDRMSELEAASLPKVPQTFAQALRLAAEQAEIIDQQAEKIASDKPKVKFAETIRSIDGLCHIEKIAKTLGFGRNKFFEKLRDDSILMRGNLPYQKYLDKGYFTVVEQEPYTDSKGVQHPIFTTMVTGSGQVFLTLKYSNQEDQSK